MLVLALAALCAVLFAVCCWSGSTLAQHHGDGWEVGAVGALGVAVLAALWLAQRVPGYDGGVATMGLVAAGAGGLFVGYLRHESAA